MIRILFGYWLVVFALALWLCLTMIVGALLGMVGRWVLARLLPPALPAARVVRLGAAIVRAPAQHFDGPEKSCYEYGCADDCPVALAIHPAVNKRSRPTRDAPPDRDDPPGYGY